MRHAMRRLLVVVDPMKGRDTACEQALVLARRRKAELVLIDARAARSSSRLAGTGERLELPRGEREEFQLQALVRSAEAEGVQVRSVIARHDDRARAIAAHAELVAADLVVISRDYGAPWMWRRASVAAAVGRSAHVPVLIVPPDDRHALRRVETPFTRIVVAVDFTVASGIALRSAARLIGQGDGHGTAVHALSPALPMVFSGGEAYRAIQDWRARTVQRETRLRRAIPAAAGRRITPRVVAGDAGQAILDVAAETYADLVVMGVPRRDRRGNPFAKSTFGAVVRRTRRPVLAIPVAAGGYRWEGDADALALREWQQQAA